MQTDAVQPPSSTLERASKHLGFGTKIAYGAGDMAGSAAITIYGFFVSAFLLDVAGLRPAAIGVIFLISQVWDAVIDPLIGVLCDRTQSRHGRKRVWLLYGAVPFGAAYAMHWFVPPLEGWGLFSYYLVVALLFKTALSAVSVPHAALASDMTNDYHERIQLITYRSVLNLFASLLAISLHPILVSFGGDDVRVGHFISGGVWGAFIVVVVLVAFHGTRENAPQPLRSRVHVLEDFKALMQNRAFVIATGVLLFSFTVVLLVQNNLLLYTRYWARLEAQFTLVILIFQVTAMLFIAIWSRVARYVDKKWIYVIGATIWAGSLSALYFTPRGELTPYLVISFLIGAGAAVAYIIPSSMLPDAIDLDELRTGERREGLFYSMFGLLQQIGLSLGLAASGFALEAAGYVNPATVGAAVTQPDSVLMTLRILVSFVPAAILLVSLPIAIAYPINKARYQEIQQQLRQRTSR
jgi:glycoside/pentoside/hexuronide:cation symporter, GPH family